MTVDRIKEQADKVFTFTMPVSVAACAAAVVFQAFGSTPKVAYDPAVDIRLAALETKAMTLEKPNESTNTKLSGIEARITSLELQVASTERQQRDDRNDIMKLLYAVQGSIGRIEGQLGIKEQK